MRLVAAPRGETDRGAGGGFVSDDDAWRGARGTIGAANHPAVPTLGKRGKPDGRVLQPPKKRVTVGGEDDPGFVS